MNCCHFERGEEFQVFLRGHEHRSQRCFASLNMTADAFVVILSEAKNLGSFLLLPMDVRFAQHDKALD
jgi:hypothetical protein